jgi:predicted membrane chloride channel (bestrophin family)
MIECDNKQLEFVVFIINNLAKQIKKPVSEVYEMVSKNNILDEYIIGCYDVLHTLGTQYLMKDIEELLKNKGVLQ